MTAPKTLPRSWWANDDWRRGGAALVDNDLWRLGNVNHYPGRSSDFGRLSLESLRRNIRGWWNYHVNTRGWSDIGYQVAIAITEDGPVLVDLRGIGRVPAAHASASNPRANWHGGATLWLIGNTESIEDQLIDAYRWFRHEVWLPRWPTATGVTHHRRVPGASTACAGDEMNELVLSGTLKTAPLEDDMPSPKNWDDGDWDIARRQLLGTGADLARGTNSGVQMTPWAAENWPDHLNTTVAGLLGYIAVNSRNAAGAVRAPVRWADGEERSFAHTLSYLQRAVVTMMEVQQGSDAPAILARLEEVAAADAARDEAVLNAVESLEDVVSALEAGDPTAALTKLRDILSTALTETESGS